MRPLVVEGYLSAVGRDEDGDMTITVDAGEFEHVVPIPEEDAADWVAITGTSVRLTTTVEVLP